ncbi:MAG: aldo/keto reductase [Clostridiales Family XIII bacterium]|jgi:aryl-alcohol dehydrogenase-like predicted oxidoreductase|nr:aldo/keto reductase [Clostridiales Family XIII bacterium]
MKMRRLGNTGIFVTPAGMGVLTVGRTQLALPISEGARVVRHAIEQGIGFFDTAEYYETYPYIRRALDGLAPSFHQSALPRPVIASKSLAAGYEGMRKAIDGCRAALGIDQIDIFLLHEIRQAPDFANRAGAWACLHDAKAKGHVKAIGVSTHHTCAAAEAARAQGMDVLFPLINYQGLGIRKGAAPGTKEEMAEAIRAASARGVGVFTMKAFGGGNLAKDYKKALDYATSLPGAVSVMIGMGREKDVDDAVAYFEGRLGNDFVPDVSRKRMFVDRGDCEGCGACEKRCTSKAIRIGREGIAAIDTAACVLCGYCAPACPTRAIIML